MEKTKVKEAATKAKEILMPTEKVEVIESVPVVQKESTTTEYKKNNNDDGIVRIDPTNPDININRETAKVETKVQKEPVSFSLDKGFEVKNLEGLYRLAQYFVASKMLPKSYDTPEKVIAGYQYASELGIKPMQGFAGIAVINGTPSLHTDLPLALVQNSGLLTQLDEKLMDEKGNKEDDPEKIKMAYCYAKRKDDRSYAFTLHYNDIKHLKESGSRSVWKDYYKIMMLRRCRATVLKFLFPDVLKGMKIAEYDFHRAPDLEKENAIETKSKDLPSTKDLLNKNLIEG